MSRSRLRIPFVLLSRLSATQKKQYKSTNETSLRIEGETHVNEVIGEYREGNLLYYYARYDGGIAHRFHAIPFAKEYRDLVDEYERAKAEGKLEPFDPSAQYVHPLSRVKVKISISNGHRSRNARLIDGEISVNSEEEEEEEDSKESEEDEDYSAPALRKRLPRRTKSSATKELPFSPRKSRSRKIMTFAESHSDSSDQKPGPTRRSVRTKVTKIVITDDEDFLDEMDSDSQDGRVKTTDKPKAKKFAHPKPMYGRIRPVTAIRDDPFPDDEEHKALRHHRAICEKCHLKPAHLLLIAFKKKPKGKGKKRKRNTDDEFEGSEDEQKYIDMGGWVTCLKCPVSAHWKCLAGHQRDEVLAAVRAKDRKEWKAQEDNEDSLMPQKRSQLDIQETTEFVCGSCVRGGICMGCMETALEPDSFQSKSSRFAIKDAGDEDVIMEDAVKSPSPVYTLAQELLFRCFTCKRLAHYSHLPTPPILEPDYSVADIAEHYQQAKHWLCADCSSFRYAVDKILAWRPYPSHAVEASIDPNVIPNYKAQLPREYLVKWFRRSYRRVQWVPHMWLVSTHPSKLKNFISGGSKVELLQQPAVDAIEVDTEPTTLFENEPESRVDSVKAPDDTVKAWLSALPDAERRIPLAWKSIDRVLDIVLWRPTASKQVSHRTGRRMSSRKDDDEDSSTDDERVRLSSLIFDRGEEPPPSLTETVKEWETHDNLEKSDIDHVVWAFIKWEELGYDEATWDAPPRRGEKNYESFKRAFDRFLDSRNVLVQKRDRNYWKIFDDRIANDFRKHLLRDASKLELGSAPNLKLLPFQVDGFNWLCNNWWNHQHCILADEMGLGKTVQIATFLGNIAEKWKAFPALVIVPNSTITNWVREFERWAPRLRVVPFYGEKNSRDVIKQFELFHEDPPQGYTSAKFHILVTTYESVINARDFTPVFKNQPRWEVLVVDEGQRLKNDNSLLFKKLNELNSIHRIIMTGTPLNNNIRELFNLMNFLDPEEWKDLEALEREHEVLDEELVKQLHNRLRPYFLRRIKSEVLELPPKNEVIVPVTMAPLQKEVYRSILSKNLEILSGLTKPSVQNAPKGQINNILMQLRKCLQHPYLYARDLEPPNLTQQDAHEKLIDASAKLRFLRVLLPKLKEAGHRVLLFSQFVIALDILEDFLKGEGYKLLRLDGNTKNKERQKAMDEYNKPGSEYFIFLLTTRAGGVGINLFSADTVIIFDPDFNPHQDLQAIARAYRYGQQKTCLVFKLMVKESAEERIIQIGKKKLVLDHLIVQKMDDDEENGGENVQSILTYGAQALFNSEETSRDITYTENDIDKLIEKTEKEAVQEATKSENGLSFAFAKVWAADKDSLEEVQEDDQTDSWAQALQKITIEREKEQIKEIALSGRGARRRAADIAKTKMQVDPGTLNNNKRTRSEGSNDSVYSNSEDGDDDDSDDAMADGDFAITTKSKLPQVSLAQVSDIAKNNPLTSSSHNVEQQQPTIDCGLCGYRHGFGECLMVDRSANLAEYREMLILHADDEPWEERNAAIRAIDEILYKRGDIALIAGQPLHPFVKELPSSKSINPSSGTENLQAEFSSHAGGARKKSKAVMPPVSSCPLCAQAPHLLKDCPLVRAGSKSISTHIKILEGKNDPALMTTLNVLRNLLPKYKAQETAAVSSSSQG